LEGDIPVWFGPAGAPADALRAGRSAIDLEEEAEKRRIRAAIAQDVRDVEDRAKLLQITARAVDLSAESLAAEDKKLDAGRSTAFDLLRAQEILIASRANQALVAYELLRAQLRLRARIGDFTAPP
jgi:outer membrane protein TolC